MKNAFLAGEKIYLRTIEESDLNDNYQSWLNDEEVCEFNSHHLFPNYKEDMHVYYENTIKSKNNIVLAIIDKKTEKHIGNIALHDINFVNNNADLTIMIGNKNFWGKGVGVEAMRLIMEHGFVSLNMHKIFFGTTNDNLGMQRLADKLGFKKEGILRESMFKNGEYKDIIKYGILKNEYKK